MDRFHTTTLCPDTLRFLIMHIPIAPQPKNPNVSFDASTVDSTCGLDFIFNGGVSYNKKKIILISNIYLKAFPMQLRI